MFLQENKKECNRRNPRLSDTRCAAEGSAREMKICMQQIGWFRDYTFYLLVTFNEWSDLNNIWHVDG